jgi:1,4-alpha-glucan branching enzyme
MKFPVVHIIVLFMAFILSGCLSGRKQKEMARIENGRFIVSFDLRWNEDDRFAVASLYDLDSALIEAVYSNKTVYLSDSIIWQIDLTDRHIAEVSKQLEEERSPLIRENDLLLLDDGWVRRDEVSEKPPAKFGINRLKDDSALEFDLSDSLVTFRLKGFGNAGSVFLAGSFNGWNTMSTPMKKAVGDTGTKDDDEYWTATIILEPGKYSYKYIIDGKWITDPSNLLKEREDGRGIVSVVYSPNMIFKLGGYSDARRVVLTGNFINWNRRGLLMKKVQDLWELPAYLSDGTWSYKFISDGEWLPDPANQDNRQDASGNVNSFLSIGDKHRFTLKGFARAEKVVLTGSFNKWDENELVMERDSAGWVLDYVTGPGNWEYKFIADGEWMPDPENPYTTGSGDYVNSLISVNPNHIFRLPGFSEAENVMVTGTFSNWSMDDYRMIKSGGEWILPLHLKKGKTLYKFIVDGEWMTDPGNENWEDNQYGTGNSVLWIE